MRGKNKGRFLRLERSQRKERVMDVGSQGKAQTNSLKIFPPAIFQSPPIVAENREACFPTPRLAEKRRSPTIFEPPLNCKLGLNRPGLRSLDCATSIYRGQPTPYQQLCFSRRHLDAISFSYIQAGSNGAYSQSTTCSNSSTVYTFQPVAASDPASHEQPPEPTEPTTRHSPICTDLRIQNEPPLTSPIAHDAYTRHT